MRRNSVVRAGIVAVAATVVLVAQSHAGGWLHVRVEEPGKSSKVSVNLPLAVVEAALSAAPEMLESHGRVHLGHHGNHDMSLADLRRVWSELKNAGDTDFVTVEEERGESVKVARRGELVEIHVTKRGKEEVNVQVPLALVDVLLTGEGDRLNLKGALTELQKRRGDIVRVNDENSSVRIWIDERNQVTP